MRTKIILLLFSVFMLVSFQSDRLPDVLIIGDSISIGYFPFVKQALEGKANVVHNPGNAAHTGKGLARLDDWLGDISWDIIHFNWGLHDLCYRSETSTVYGNRDKINGTVCFSHEEYGRNLEELVIRLNKTGAKLIFATTSYVPEGEAGRFFKDDVKYNKVALEIMKRYGVQVNELNEVSRRIHKDHKKEIGDVHYTNRGYQLLAEPVIEIIESNLHIQNQEMQTFGSYQDAGYDQELRPQYHFSSMKGWNNDPNGMVWYDGEYHLFFQHNPKGLKWGNMTWGHAVSTDMVHWKQLPHAILPYGGGTIFSGTAVVDHNNSLGKQKGDIKTIVAFFSFAKKPFYQAAAYSTDKGRSFTLVNGGGPLVPNQGFDQGERDPKVFWHEESGKWVMVLWVLRGKGDGSPEEKLGKVRFFTSDNLQDWEVASDFDRDWVFECMDLVELPVDGDENNKKWLLYDASFDYEIGDFDGKIFTTDRKVFKGDYGSAFYAAQTFNNSPDNRTVMIGWLRTGGDYKNMFLDAEMPFNQSMSFPTTMELKTTPEGIRLYRWPVREIEDLYLETYHFNNLSLKRINKNLAGIEAELIDMSMEFEPVSSFEVIVRGLKLEYLKDREEFVFEKSRLKAPAIDGRVKLRILVDRASIELFASEGASVSTNSAIPDLNNKSISISAEDELKIHNLTVNELKSSW